MDKKTETKSKKNIAITVDNLHITYRGLKKTSIRASWKNFGDKIEIYEALKAVSFEVEEGKIYNAKVVKVEDFGCFVEIWPGCEGLVHVSQLAHERVEKPSDVVAVGDEILVKALGADKRGRQNFSRKDALPKKVVRKKESINKELEKETKEENTKESE